MSEGKGDAVESPAESGKPVDLLLEAFRQERPGAFDAIVRAHQDRVFSFCARMLSDREEALDASQEVFLSAWRNLATFRGEAALSTWLLRIAANRCLNRIRQRKSSAAREEPWPEAKAGGEAQEFQPAAPEEGRPDRIAENREVGEILSEALGRIDPESRWLVLLSDVEGFSYEELAEMAGVPVGTVKSRLHRTRMALRRMLSQAV
ncbi:MAG TPA: sigma-70 family RNA polymerase sigma factor [Candidatus Deferrimicrobiaceae bacterium]